MTSIKEENAQFMTLGNIDPDIVNRIQLKSEAEVRSFITKGKPRTAYDYENQGLALCSNYNDVVLDLSLMNACGDYKLMPDQMLEQMDPSHRYENDFSLKGTTALERQEMRLNITGSTLVAKLDNNQASTLVRNIRMITTTHTDPVTEMLEQDDVIGNIETARSTDHYHRMRFHTPGVINDYNAPQGIVSKNSRFPMMRISHEATTVPMQTMAHGVSFDQRDKQYLNWKQFKAALAEQGRRNKLSHINRIFEILLTGSQPFGYATGVLPVKLGHEFDILITTANRFSYTAVDRLNSFLKRNAINITSMFLRDSLNGDLRLLQAPANALTADQIQGIEGRYPSLLPEGAGQSRQLRVAPPFNEDAIPEDTIVAFDKMMITWQWITDLAREFSDYDGLTGIEARGSSKAFRIIVDEVAQERCGLQIKLEAP